MKRLSVSSLILLSAIFANPARAVVVYDDITGATYGSGGVDTGYYPLVGQTQTFGIQFTPSVSGYIDDLTLSAFGSSEGQADVYSSTGPSVGSMIETLALSESVSEGTYATGSYQSGAILTAGVPYWIILTGPELQFWWVMNGSQDASAYVYQAQAAGDVPFVANGYTYTAPGQYGLEGLRIDVAPASAVPEPPMLPVLLTGLIATFGGMRLRGARRVVRSSPPIAD